jgi:hypothetical protein
MSQAAEILRDLKRGKKITPLDGLRVYGSLRLGARIYDLKRKGHPIKTETITDRKSGKRYARYSMEHRHG